MPLAQSAPPSVGDPAALVIDPRFCGPPDAGNGGYVAGALASVTGAGGAVEVTLRRPAPLAMPLAVRPAPGGLWMLADGTGAAIAEARATTEAPRDRPPALPALAATAALAPDREQEHPFPGCFVCGPARAAGDGLRIRPRVVPGTPVAAALWTPARELAGPGGFVAPAFVWAALDCPGYFGVVLDGPRPPLLLGRITAAITGPVRAGARLRVLGWALARDGRRHGAATVLVDEVDRVVAHSRQVWIAPRTSPPTTDAEG